MRITGIYFLKYQGGVVRVESGEDTQLWKFLAMALTEGEAELNRVLIADDDEACPTLLETRLSRWGYEPITCTDTAPSPSPQRHSQDFHHQDTQKTGFKRQVPFQGCLEFFESSGRR